VTQPVQVWDGEAEAVHVGTLYAHRRRGTESASFTYDPPYLARPGATMWGPDLPLSAAPHHTPAGRKLFGAMADGAPDRWGRTLLTRQEARRAREEGRQARLLGEVDFLLGVRDDLRQGSLRYRLDDGPFLATEADGVPLLTDLPALLELAQQAERDAVTLPDLNRLVNAGGSLGGARPKAHVVTREGRLAIAKFPSADRDTWDVMAWERVALVLAADAGIHVPRSSLISVAGRAVLVVERFDRRPSGADAGDGGAESWRRVGYASAMTMLEANDGASASYVDIAAVIEEVSDRASEDLEQLWRRLLFSVAIGNTDDHLRNHGFLRQAGLDAWRLSPAFDVNPDPTLGPKHHATSIDGSDAPATIARAMAVARDFRLRDAEAERIAADVLGAVACWREVAHDVGLAPSAIEAMAPAFGESRG